MLDSAFALKLYVCVKLYPCIHVIPNIKILVDGISFCVFSYSKKNLNIIIDWLA